MIKEKKRVLDMIEALPENSTVGDILEELYFRLAVDRGIKELDGGKGISHRSAKNRLSKWLRK